MDWPGTVRPATPADAAAMARLHVQSWRETYRGLMPDAVLDDPEFEPRRERFWTAALTEERHRDNRAAVAVLDDEIVGVAMSGPPLHDDPVWDRQLYVLYVAEALHGRGAGAALLDAVTDPREVTGLWVADPNPRAQAFYLAKGFAFDGGEMVDQGVRELRMRRDAAPVRT